MQETSILRQLTNLPNFNQLVNNKSTSSISRTEKTQELPRPKLEDLLSINSRNLDFGMCLPGTVKEKFIYVTILADLPEKINLKLFLLCEDDILNESSELVFGINQRGESEYYDDYRLKISKKGTYQFRVGAKAPSFYSYNVKSMLGVQLDDYAPYFVTLEQVVQIPEIVCLRELDSGENRVIKVSVMQGKSKKQCKIPFRMNQAMTISATSEIIGLNNEHYPLLDIKPKSMNLVGKGQFSLILVTNLNEEIKTCVLEGRPFIVRRILMITTKEKKLIYHFPLEVTYHPQKIEKTISTSALLE